LSVKQKSSQSVTTKRDSKLRALELGIPFRLPREAFIQLLDLFYHFYLFSHSGFVQKVRMTQISIVFTLYYAYFPFFA